MRVAWSEDALLVDVVDVPEDARVEVAIGTRAGESRLSRVEPGIRTGPGLLVVPLSRTPAVGELRTLRVNVVLPDGDGAVALPWTPPGTTDLADPDHPPRVMLVERTGHSGTVEITPDWMVLADGAQEVRVDHLRAAVPRSSRGVPDAWSLSGEPGITARSAQWGWHEAVALWTGEDASPVHLATARRFSEPEGPPDVDRDALFFPPVARLVPDYGRAFELEDGASLCVDHPSLRGVADLFVREATRVTGRMPARSDGGRCVIRIALQDGVFDGDLPRVGADEERPELLPADGFSIEVNRKGIVITGAGVRGAAAGALAVVDALGPDATLPHLSAADWPAIAERPLYYALNVGNRPDLTVDDVVTFIERVVARGRYTHLYLFLSDGLALPSTRGLSRSRALSPPDISRLAVTASAVGIELLPAVNAPGHADWIVRHRPEWGEDVGPALLDVRHPDVRGFLDDHYTEVWQAYGSPDRMHLGHDEAVWMTDRWFGDERNPRTSSSPRAVLLAEDLRWHLQWCAEHGVKPYIWGDLLLAGWNGSRDGGHRTLDLLTDEERRQLTIMAWSPLGDPLGELGARYGLEVQRVHTGYLDWKREFLVRDQERIAGEGLALFQPAPWAAFGPAAGSRPLHYHLGNVLLAGATAWAPELEPAARIRPTLAALAGHPSTRPGFVAIPHATAVALEPAGLRPDLSLPSVAWPAEITLDSDVFKVDARVASVGSAVSWTPTAGSEAGTTAVSALVALSITHAAEGRLRQDVRGKGRIEDTAVARISAKLADGTEVERLLEHGEDLYLLDSDPRANTMWRSADVAPLGSTEATRSNPRARDRRLYRIDLPLDPDGTQLESVRLEVLRDGVVVVAAGAVQLVVREGT